MHALLNDLTQLEIVAYWLWYAIGCELARPPSPDAAHRYALAA